MGSKIYYVLDVSAGTDNALCIMSYIGDCGLNAAQERADHEARISPNKCFDVAEGVTRHSLPPRACERKPLR